MASSRDCKMLRPVLIAMVYGEPHPEAARLGEHLRACQRCRGEFQELREVGDWISAVMAPDSRASPSSLGRHSRRGNLLLRVVAAAVVLLVAAWIVLGRLKESETQSDVGSVAAAGDTPPGLHDAGPFLVGWASPSRVFGVDPVDIELDAIETELLALGEGSW